MLIKYNTSEMSKRIQVQRCAKCNYPTAIYNCATAKYIRPATTCNHPATSDRNYISGCFDLQWRATSDTQVYLLVQGGHLCGFLSSSVTLSAPGRFEHVFLCTTNVLHLVNNLLQCSHGTFPMV